MPRRDRLTRAAAVAAVAVATSLSLTACQWSSPITTQLQYDPADGKSGQLGDVRMLDVLVVSAAADGPGTLVGTLDNRGSTAATVKITANGKDVASVDVPAGKTVRLSDESKKTTIATVAEPPGAVTEVQFSSSTGGAVPLPVPVLAPTAPYENYKPAAKS